MSKYQPSYQPSYPQQTYTLETENYEQNTFPSAPPCYDEAVGNTTAPLTVPVQPYPSQPIAQVIQQPANPNVVLALPRSPLPVGPDPIKTTCPVCNTFVSSRTEKKNNLGKYFCCIAMFLSVICTCCSCIPLCTWGPVKTSHFCPKCNAFFGTFVR